jgi:hypothetical protein
MPYDMGNQQPTFSPWVNPAAAPISMFLDHLASVMNPTSAKGLHAATEVEKLVVRWLEELIGFPTVGSGGIFVKAARWRTSMVFRQRFIGPPRNMAGICKRTACRATIPNLSFMAHTRYIAASKNQCAYSALA